MHASHTAATNKKTPESIAVRALESMLHLCTADVGSRIGLQIMLVQRAYPELIPMMCLARGETGSWRREPRTLPPTVLARGMQPKQPNAPGTLVNARPPESVPVPWKNVSTLGTGTDISCHLTNLSHMRMHVRAHVHPSHHDYHHCLWYTAAPENTTPPLF
eukprot:1137380-Pelagomonas_calceolata.AAC.6